MEVNNGNKEYNLNHHIRKSPGGSIYKHNQHCHVLTLFSHFEKTNDSISFSPVYSYTVSFSHKGRRSLVFGRQTAEFDKLNHIELH